MSDREELVLTRKELYDLVRLKPLRDLAEKFGMSDVARTWIFAKSQRSEDNDED